MSERTGYRLIKRKYAANAFSGEGAKRFGGRWNSKGTAVVYLAESMSLAMLEVMVHLEDYNTLQHYLCFQMSFDTKNLMTLTNDDLPRNWQEYPAPAETADIGDQWVNECASVLLSVPSVIVPNERNYLLNINHPNFNNSTNISPIEFLPDTRL